MHPFAVVACVSQQRIDSAARGRSQHHLDQVWVIGARTAPGNSRQDQMGGTITDQTHLRKTAIGHRLFGLTAFRPSSYEVVAGVVGFESGAVDGR